MQEQVMVKVSSKWVLNRVPPLPEVPTYRSAFAGLEYAYMNECEVELLDEHTYKPTLRIRDNSDDDWCDITSILAERYHHDIEAYKKAMPSHPATIFQGLEDGLELHIPYSVYLELRGE